MKALSFLNTVEHQENPLSVLSDFLDTEKRLEESQQIEKMRFVG